MAVLRVKGRFISVYSLFIKLIRRIQAHQENAQNEIKHVSRKFLMKSHDCPFKVVGEDLKSNQLVGTNRTRHSPAQHFHLRKYSPTTFNSFLLTSFLHFFTPAPFFLLPLFLTVSYKLVQTYIFYPELFCNVPATIFTTLLTSHQT